MSIHALVEGCLKNDTRLHGLIFCDEEGECIASAVHQSPKGLFQAEDDLAAFGAGLGPSVQALATAALGKVSYVHFEQSTIWIYRMRGNYFLAAVYVRASIPRDTDQVLRFVAETLECEIP